MCDRHVSCLKSKSNRHFTSTLASFLSVLLSFASFSSGKDSDRKESSVKQARNKHWFPVTTYNINRTLGKKKKQQLVKRCLVQEKQKPGMKESWLSTPLCWSDVVQSAARWFSLLVSSCVSTELLLLLWADDFSGLGLSECACRHSTLLPLARTSRLDTEGGQEMWCEHNLWHFLLCKKTSRW